MGDRWSDKLRRIYAIEPASDEPSGPDPGSVTDVVLTHLHFDHARGIFRARPGEEGEVDLRYPRARVHVQAANLRNAKAPNVRERASYVAEDTAALDRVRLVPAAGTGEIAPGILVHEANGHTRGHQWVEVRAEGRSLAFPSDIVPTPRSASRQRLTNGLRLCKPHCGEVRPARGHGTNAAPYPRTR